MPGLDNAWWITLPLLKIICTVTFHVCNNHFKYFMYVIDNQTGGWPVIVILIIIEHFSWDCLRMFNDWYSGSSLLSTLTFHSYICNCSQYRLHQYKKGSLKWQTILSYSQSRERAVYCMWPTSFKMTSLKYVHMQVNQAPYWKSSDYLTTSITLLSMYACIYICTIYFPLLT